MNIMFNTEKVLHILIDVNAWYCYVISIQVNIINLYSYIKQNSKIIFVTFLYSVYDVPLPISI